jgi:hypothetical protein
VTGVPEKTIFQSVAVYSKNIIQSKQFFYSNRTSARLILFKLLQSGSLGPSWPWSYGSWILQVPMQSVPITTDVVSSNLDQGKVDKLCDKVCQWLVTGQWFSTVSSTNKTDRYSRNIVESGVKHHQTKKQTNWFPVFT